MFIDTHCHLNFHLFENDIRAVILQAEKENVKKIIIPGAKIDSSEKAIEISRSYDNCYAAIGIHPHHALEEMSHTMPVLKNKLLSLASNPKVAAMGEIGMDYHHYKNSLPPDAATKEIQKNLFLIQLEIAYEKNLPVIIHCRWAQTDTYEIIVKFIKNRPLRGVFHCFDGSLDYLRKILSLGFYIGFDGNSTYPENTHLQQLIKATPLEKLLLETDSPFLTPQSHRGQRNEPKYLPEIAKLISKLHSASLDHIETITSKNAITLFRI
jgi:TatD DNase family protein